MAVNPDGAFLGIDVGKDLHQADITKIDDRTRDILFGASQFQK